MYAQFCRQQDYILGVLEILVKSLQTVLVAQGDWKSEGSLLGHATDSLKSYVSVTVHKYSNPFGYWRTSMAELLKDCMLQ